MSRLTALIAIPGVDTSRSIQNVAAVTLMTTPTAIRSRMLHAVIVIRPSAGHGLALTIR